jgi:hypothetical protein
MRKKIKINSRLYDHAKRVAKHEGYSSIEEFITTIIERELSQLEIQSDGGDAVNDQLRGLGYIE